METSSEDAHSEAATTRPLKRFRPLSVSPTKELEQLMNLPGGRCVKCKQDLGPDCKAIQCDLCGSWIHSRCESVSDEVYENMNDVVGSLNNLVYYCDTNNCISRIKQLLFTYLEDDSQSFETKVASVIKETVPACSSDSYNELKSQMGSVTTQIKDLITHNSQLQKQIEAISTSINNIQKTSYAAVAAQASTVPSPNSSDSSSGPPIHHSSQPTTPDELRNAVSSVISEEKDKQKRRLNLIVHNMAESSSDQPQSRKEQDIACIRDILHSQLEVQPCISNAVRLGKRGGPKPRLLKITVESEEEKVAILRNVKRLRLPSTPDPLKRIFITPDLTPREREVNKALRSELAERNKSAKQFIIKNGQIVQRRE